jgi:cyclopropane fatty-acyl-phospholipid synthase-like methyltransferase
MADELGIPPGTCANWYRTGNSRAKPSSAYGRLLKSFLLGREVIAVERFIEKQGPELLEQIGFRKDMTVMDFGCGNGDYSLMLARVVAPGGRVYSVDKDRGVLYEMRGRARGKKLNNIEPTLLYGEGDTPTNLALSAGSIEAAWFSDVLHDGYFEEDELKRELVTNVRRILTADGFIAIHPVHMEQKRLRTTIENSGFCLEHEYKEELLFHGNEFHKGTVLKFRSSGD